MEIVIVFGKGLNGMPLPLTG